jgi:hypothetical protein
MSCTERERDVKPLIINVVNIFLIGVFIYFHCYSDKVFLSPDDS